MSSRNKRSPLRSGRRSAKNKLTPRKVALYVLFLGLCAGVAQLLSGNLVLGGVPSSIVLQVLGDDVARAALLSGDKVALHDRMDDIGIEIKMKDYYRPRYLNNEAALDQYIHQILYERTGYVGADYVVGGGGKLVLKSQAQ